MAKRERISISIPTELKEKVEEHHQKVNKGKSVTQEQNLSQVYSLILEEGLKKFEKKV